jgi:2-desacetyl-2-hydroxyethyl bacteriochlorophyllide A dehydrogenase
MRAVTRADGGVRVVDVDEPAGPGVVVTVASAGICGTDLSMLAWPPNQLVLGHEFAGLTADGHLVAVEPVVPCGDCAECRRGASNRCVLGTSIYLGIGADGGMAERVRVRPEQLVPLPAGVAAADACLVEPIAVATHGLREAGLLPGQRVAVVGAGSIGLVAAAAARQVGCDVAVVARHPHQQRAVERVGARLDPTGAHDVVVDAAGTPEALATAADLAGPGATLLLLATYFGPITLPGIPMMTKELRAIATMAYNRGGSGRDMVAAAGLLGARPELGDILISHRFPLDDAAEAFRVAADRAAGAIKVVLLP